MPKGLKQLTALFIAALLVAPVGSQANRGELPLLDLARFDETYNPQVHTGGHILVGATTDDDSQDYLLKPAIFLPRPIYSRLAALCVETVSIDGAYSSQGELSGTDIMAHGGAVRFRPGSTGQSDGTKFSRVIRKFGPSQAAVLASSGPCNTDENRNNHTFAVVDRSNLAVDRSATRHFHLFINPKWAHDVEARYTTRDGKSAHIPCGPAPEGLEQTAFSLVCDLPGPFPDVTHVELLLERYGHPLPPERFDLVYATSH